MEEKQLIFFSGGARSGKSTFAEQYATKIAKQENRKLYYVATAKKSDDEMEDRINRHQHDRMTSGFSWETIEIPMNIASEVNAVSPNSVVLLDCLTILLSNELFRNGFYEESWNNNTVIHNVITSIMCGIDALQDRVNTLIIVSNEVVYDTVKENETLVQTYSKMLGLLHQKIVQKATKAVAVEASIPIVMKENSRCEAL